MAKKKAAPKKKAPVSIEQRLSLDMTASILESLDEGRAKSGVDKSRTNKRLMKRINTTLTNSKKRLEAMQEEVESEMDKLRAEIDELPEKESGLMSDYLDELIDYYFGNPEEEDFEEDTD